MTYSKTEQLARGPKRKRRLIDDTATRRTILIHPVCAACGNPATNGHHVVPKGAPHFGDDTIDNIVGLCGSGTTRCHGAFHGSPYTVSAMRPHPSGRPDEIYGPFPERRDAEWVARRIGKHLQQERLDVILYVLDKLGRGAGREFLARTYYVGRPE